MGRLFGTDGVRDVANGALSPELAFRLGRAGAAVVAAKRGATAGAPSIVIGRDTRLSGDMLAAALAAGMMSAGARVLHAGVVPTPGVAYLVRELGADAGAVISASHNPVEYNGIKFFSHDGFKLSDEEEEEIERHVLDEAGRVRLDVDDGLPRPTGGGVGKSLEVADARDRYVKFVKSTCDVTLEGLRIVVDCANGAAFASTPRLLRELGAEVVSVSDVPDGTNINVDCGSTHPDAVCRAVLETKADIGLAHDGDADRLVAVDERGQLVDGDHIMAICGLYLLRQGRLPQKTIVATVYSNLGLVKAFEREGGSVVLAKAGDRYVLEEMRKRGVVLGGEQSGHIIFLDRSTTGDGAITALALLSVVRKTGLRLSELASWMQTFPQVLVNVRVRDKNGLVGNGVIDSAIARAAARLGSDGRIFVRPSGTEPLVRVLGEGPDREAVEEVVRDVAKVIGDALS
ncbi:MAG: phosphoglucosamine mutase [Firmicutes bacterium]|nr:phosphoglucosamine mutase [Bacillota bacterium]MDH7495275.1 phosphoglucosamine mutase [Bacillota bacterium]